MDIEERLRRIEGRLKALEDHKHSFGWDPDDEKNAYDEAMAEVHGAY